MELIFNPCGEFWWSLGGPVSQIHSPHLHVDAPGIFFRSFKVSYSKERVGCGKKREATTTIQSLVKLQPWFLRLRWKTSLRQNCSLGSCTCSEGPALGQNTDMIIITIKWPDKSSGKKLGFGLNALGSILDGDFSSILSGLALAGRPFPK